MDPPETDIAALQQLLLEARSDNFRLQQRITELEEQLEKVVFRMEKFKVDNDRLCLQNDYLKAEVVEHHQDFLKKLVHKPKPPQQLDERAGPE